MNKQTKRSDDPLWPRLKGEARRMRRQPTEAEQVLWERLRGRQVAGFKFRRQHPINRFVVDFCCPEAKLVVEVDGPVHGRQVEPDAAREEELCSLDLRVLRFDNDAVLKATDKVLRAISEALEENQ
jgi:very-short-patch-repair endonuclease